MALQVTRLTILVYMCYVALKVTETILSLALAVFFEAVFTLALTVFF